MEQSLTTPTTVEKKNSAKKPRCSYCRRPSIVLIQCSKCNDEFCVSDRLPEAHMCREIEAYKKERVIIDKVVASKIVERI